MAELKKWVIIGGKTILYSFVLYCSLFVILQIINFILGFFINNINIIKSIMDFLIRYTPSSFIILLFIILIIGFFVAYDEGS